MHIQSCRDFCRRRGDCRLHRLGTSLFLVSLYHGLAGAQSVTPQITIDQFGWQSRAAKIAVMADPVKGQNASDSYQPGPRFEVRSEPGDAVLFRGVVKPWNNGKVSELAGDRVWYADFTGLEKPGTYHLYDPTRKARSYPFRIADDVYRPALRDSVRTFYYQRSGTAIPAHFGNDWHHPAAHVGRNQELAAQYSQGGQALGRPRDVHGGWFDAGDLNKYVPYLESTLFDLLWAYELNPGVFDDDTNIPESGNGVPDLLDELKWELDWLLKMQDNDGGVFNRVAGRSFDNGSDPPQTDTQPRFYSAETTWATATAAASFAHAARVFKRYDKSFPGYRAQLQTAAERAWDYLKAHPTITPADGSDGEKNLAATAAGSNPNGDRRSRIYAAAELYKTFGKDDYKAYVDRWAPDVEATADNGMHPLKGYKKVDPLNHTALTQALFVYATTPSASASVVGSFKEALAHSAEEIRGAAGGPDDPYLAFHYEGHYCWGSNQCKGRWGRVLLMAIALDINPRNHRAYRELAAGYLHFIHGRNPLSLCFLTNMNRAGADRCPTELFHAWFRDGSPLYDGKRSRYGPAPGYLVGGPNKFFSVDWISPPHGEPAMKAFRDWNTGWNAQRKANECSWEVTEPAIYYQAAYTLLLSQFVPGSSARGTQWPGRPTW
jgi:endoglucanase